MLLRGKLLGELYDDYLLLSYRYYEKLLLKLRLNWLRKKN